jgi:hypothetical protein
MRTQNFFTGIGEAIKDLDWEPQYDSAESILRDSYQRFRPRQGCRRFEEWF